jgi:hypothetical protein
MVTGIFKFMKTERFNLFFSFILGFGLAALLKPMCKGEGCITRKAPSHKELEESTYQLSHKCYRFKSTHVDCPSEGGMSEAFRNAIQRSSW